MTNTAALLAFVLAAATALAAQGPPRPRPFPGAAQPSTQTAPAQGRPQAPAADPSLGIPLYPGAELLGTYEAGPNQQMHIYGSSAVFTTVVEFYRTALRDRGRQLFGGPMHQFDLARYRRETMMLQPAVTVKDFTWNGREGYVHVSGRQIVKYPTVIQVVPAMPER